MSLLSLASWSSFSTFWYMCKIKDACFSEQSTEVVPSTLPSKEVKPAFESLEIFYPTATYTLTQTDSLSTVISNIVDYWKDNLPSKIQLIGCTDSVGAQHRNLELGFKRAQYFGEELKKHGIPEEALLLTSMGEVCPKYSNVSIESRSKNRRLEVNMIEQTYPCNYE